jgi:DNA uptake protein ComE-like DNA-binding protein
MILAAFPDKEDPAMRTLLLALIFLGATSATYAQNDASRERERTAVKIDLNSASEHALSHLPGVGALGAKVIIAGRPYTSVSDLSAAGISKDVVERITPLVTVGAAETAGATRHSLRESRRSAVRLRHARPNRQAAPAPKMDGEEPQNSIDINHATLRELYSLPLMTEQKAREIVMRRPFAAVSDLALAGFSQEEIAAWAPFIYVKRLASTTDIHTGIRADIE